MEQRDYKPFDHVLMGVDQTLRVLFGRPNVTERPNPASKIREADLTEQEKQHVAKLMRINHTGEVCAQALYQGQALTAKLPEVRESMERSAREENDHLDWCDTRLKELGDRKSFLNPIWFAGSFAIGAFAGLAGDKWSLGFVAETERQVESHLDDHLTQLTPADEKSRVILEQMKQDEMHHADVAVAGGGVELPAPVKSVMQLTSKIMTKTVYWL